MNENKHACKIRECSTKQELDYDERTNFIWTCLITEWLRGDNCKKLAMPTRATWPNLKESSKSKLIKGNEVRNNLF